MDAEQVIEILEKYWSGEVDTRWKPPKDLFDKKSAKIASTLKKKSKNLKQAMSRLNFYINRAGKNLSPADKKRLGVAKKKLSKKYK